MGKIITAFKNPIKTFLLLKNIIFVHIKSFFGMDVTDMGERCYIDFNKINLDKFDIYQKSHFKRYEFSKKYINKSDVIGDLACGTGYGSAILSEAGLRVDGYDISKKAVLHNKRKYLEINNLAFFNHNILDLQISNLYSKIISFETIEHLEEEDIPKVFKIFYQMLKPNGLVIFSVPYMQEDSEIARKMGFHKTFNINEETIKPWLSSAGFTIEDIFYQNYDTHEILKKLEKKEFIICIAKKND